MKIFIIGPGGVGKTTCGKILAKLLNYNFIDLDQEFYNQIENIGTYLDKYGYEKYCYANSKLFFALVKQQTDNFVFVLSSGFLVHEDLPELALKHAEALKQLGTSILLLPSESLEESVGIVIKRQLSRGFGLKEEKERIKFSQRYNLYKQMGDVKIFSHAEPEYVALSMKNAITNFTSN